MHLLFGSFFRRHGFGEFFGGVGFLQGRIARHSFLEKLSHGGAGGGCFCRRRLCFRFRGGGPGRSLLRGGAPWRKLFGGRLRGLFLRCRLGGGFRGEAGLLGRLLIPALGFGGSLSGRFFRRFPLSLFLRQFLFQRFHRLLVFRGHL
jgi:hypothetical protein